MRWKPGDKCILDAAVFNRIVKTLGPENHREPEVYVVVDSDPTQAVVIIANKEGRTSLVLDSWIVPLKGTDWKACKQILEKSSTPTELIKRLNETKPAEPTKEQPKEEVAPTSDPLPDTKKTLMKMLDQLEIALSGSVTIIIAIAKVFFQRHW